MKLKLTRAQRRFFETAASFSPLPPAVRPRRGRDIAGGAALAQMKEYMSLHVYSAHCAWHGPINATKVMGPGIPCCPHCSSVLYQIEEEKWQAGIPVHEAKGHTNYGALMAWIAEQPRCYTGLLEAAAAFHESTGLTAIVRLPESEVES